MIVSREHFTEAVRVATGYLSGLAQQAKTAEDRLRELDAALIKRQAEVDGLGRERDEKRQAFASEVAQARGQALAQLDAELETARSQLTRLIREVGDAEAKSQALAGQREAAAALERALVDLQQRKDALTRGVESLRDLATGLSDTVATLEARKAAVDAALDAALQARSR